MSSLGGGVRRALVGAWSLTWMLYTSSHRKGCRHTLLHLLACLTLGLSLGGAVLLGLSSLSYGGVVCGAVAGSVSLGVAGVLFRSRRVRCLSLLLLLSCCLKQGRNLLLTAGTTLVVLWNIHNTFNNLREVAQSLVCNLEKKRLSLSVSPVENYVRLLRWVGQRLQTIPDFGLVKFESSLTVGHRVESSDLTAKLQQAAHSLNASAHQASASFRLAMSVFQRAAPAVGVTLVVIATTLFLRSYFRNRRYQNVFITSRWVHYDQQQRAEGRPGLLPLSPEEAARFISIPTARLTRREGLSMLWFLVPVLTYLPAWLFFMALDALLYWLILTVNKHLLELKPFNVLLKMDLNVAKNFGIIHVAESQHTEDFSYSASLYEEECLPKPTLLLASSLAPLLAILGVLLVLVLVSAKMGQLKLLVLEQFYCDIADERVRELHAKISRSRARPRPPPQSSALVKLLNSKTFWLPLLFRSDKGTDPTQQL